MAEPQKLVLTAFMRPVSLHTGAWRYPGSDPSANFSLQAHISFIQKLEAAKVHSYFLADHLAVVTEDRNALKRSHTSTSFEPFTLLSALSQHTSRIGLAATASTTYEEPYHIARRFASLDHISEGRVGWNVVTTGNPSSSLNFSKDEHLQHEDRYKRAEEFFKVVTGLWDSIDDDAFERNVETGIFFDPDKSRQLNHKGDIFQVKGPLNIARPPQGHPVIFQAGSSGPGRDLAAATADAVFAAVKDIPAAKELSDDIKGRARKLGREVVPLILPAAMIIVGDTIEDAQQKRLKLDSLVHYESSIASLSTALGVDASKFDPDGPLPKDLPETNASKTSRASVERMAAEEGLTVRQLAQRQGGYSGLAFVGTAESIADDWQKWRDAGACDGFTMTMPYLPQGLNDIVDRLVPELQKRGLFQTEYRGKTLRENLGLPPLPLTH